MKKGTKVLRETQEQFVVKEMDYSPNISEVREDMLIFAERLEKVGLKANARKFRLIAATIEVTVCLLSELAIKEVWDFDK